MSECLIFYVGKPLCAIHKTKPVQLPLAFAPIRFDKHLVLQFVFSIYIVQFLSINLE